MTPYLETVKSVYENAPLYADRTGKGRNRQFGAVETYSLEGNTLPADTTTQLYLKTLTREILGMIKGSNRVEDLGKAFWDKWSPNEEDIEKNLAKLLEVSEKNNDKDAVEFFSNPRVKESLRDHLTKLVGTIGPMYGVLWRNFPRVSQTPLAWVKGVEDIPSDKLKLYRERFAAEIVMGGDGSKNTEENFNLYALGMFNQSFDQLAKVVKELKENPYSSRHRVTAFHPDTIGSEDMTPKENVLAGKAALAPCHTFFQFMVTDKEVNGETKKHLNCMLYMSSSDVMIGRPYNICQYSLMTLILAHCLDMEPGEFTLVSCDTHIYEHHKEDGKVEEHLSRIPLPYPKVVLNPNKKDFFDFTEEDITIVDYRHYPKIDYEVAV